MNYIYDIILNFQPQYIPFYEWEKNDEIINVRKIPLYRINDKSYLEIKNNNIIFDTEFVKIIENKTLLYSGNNDKNMCLLTNNKEVHAVLLDKNGNIKKRSSMLFDEEDEAIEISSTINTIKINYDIISSIDKNEFTSRKDKILLLKSIEFINKLFNNNDISVLKYIYYDLFEKEENNINIIKEDLLKAIKISSNNINKINNILENIKKEII